MLQFAPSSNNTTYEEYAVFGREFAPGQTSGSGPTDFQDASPVAEPVGTVTIPPRFTISSVNYNIGGIPVPDSIIGFFSSFSQSGGTSAGSIGTQLVPIPVPNSPLFFSEANAKSYISGMTNAAPADSTHVTNSTGSITPINPSRGVDICIKSTDYSNRYAKVTIGGNSTTNQGNPLSVEYSTFTGASCS